MSISGSIGYNAAAFEDWFVNDFAQSVEGGMQKFVDIADKTPYFNRSFGESLRTGLRGTPRLIARDIGFASGIGYFKHIADYRRGIYEGTLAIRSPFNAGVKGKLGAIKGSVKVLGKAGFSALGPYFAVSEGMHDPMGVAVGTAKSVAGFSTFLAAGKVGWSVGPNVARAGFRVAGAGLKRVGLGAVSRGAAAFFGTRVIPSLLGGPIGWLALAYYGSEAASWAVGFALHTLPTFASQFRADISRSGFGGDYMDSAGAATMRQVALQAMAKSHSNARSALGQEGALLHV